MIKPIVLSIVAFILMIVAFILELNVIWIIGALIALFAIYEWIAHAVRHRRKRVKRTKR